MEETMESHRQPKPVLEHRGAPRVRRFEAQRWLKGAARLSIPEQFATSFLVEVQKAHPEYFSDLPPLPAESQ
jgi:hypothetical protein